MIVVLTSWTLWPFSFTQIPNDPYATHGPGWEERYWGVVQASSLVCLRSIFRLCMYRDKIEELLICFKVESADERDYCIEDHGFDCLCSDSALRQHSNRVFKILFWLWIMPLRLGATYTLGVPCPPTINLPWGAQDFPTSLPHMNTLSPNLS